MNAHPSIATAVAPARGRFLRIGDVKLETGLSRSTIYRLEQAKDFPKRVRISGNAMGWWSEDVDAWKADRRRRASG